MIGVALMFTGVVLLVNGLSLLGKVDPRGTIFLNLVVGTLDVGVGIHAGLTDNVFGMGQLFLFGFTYLWLAFNALTNAEDWRSFGWYCGFVTVMALPTAFMTYSEGSPWFGTFWISWALLWYLFFLMFGLGLTLRRINEFAGISTVILGLATAMIPGYLMTSGTWAGG